MLNRSIKIVEFELINYAPFYESMGITNFHFNRRLSKNDLVLILAGNGIGKSYLLTELTPEPLEHIIGRTSNRFLPEKEGKKIISFLVDESIEYKCSITYSADRRKTTCFFTKITSDGKEEELNPNGNVSSYMELCRIHLGYEKTYKNIGYISDNVKNIVTMSYNERQQLLSTWLPNTEEFLSASKIVQKKGNQADKEIKGLLSDIAKISLESYTSKLDDLKDNLHSTEDKLLNIREAINKSEVYLERLKPFSKQSLSLNLSNFKKDVAAYNKEIDENKSLFTEYKSYIDGGDKGKEKLKENIHYLDVTIAELETKLENVNHKMTETLSSIECIKGELSFDKSDKDDLVSVSKSIELLKTEISSLNDVLNSIIEDHKDYAYINNSSETRSQTKVVINTFENICSISGKMKNISGFTFNDILDTENGGLLSKLEQKISNLNDSNKALDDSNNSINEAILEKERSKIDSSIMKYVPNNCNEHTCSLIRKLLEHTKVDNDISLLKSRISENKAKIMANNLEIEKTKTQMNDIKNALVDVSQITDSLMGINDKILGFPKSLINIINDKNPVNILNNLQDILEEIKSFDEYLSILEKKNTSETSLSNLENVSKLLSIKDARNKELKDLLDLQQMLNLERDELSKDIAAEKTQKERLEKVSTSLSSILEDKSRLNNTEMSLKARKESLSIENKCVRYKREFEISISAMKAKEIDLSRYATSLKSEIEKCNSSISTREALVARQETLEKKKKVYDLLYSVWNSKTGYPSLVIKDFLTEVCYETNKNLDEMWGGLLRIEKPEINENEFRIPVQRGNTLIFDVIECSTAEKSTISIALSLAIIKVSVENNLYNILRLDEADAGFDEMRRQSYLDIILEEMRTINCRNSFIITHNQMFDNIECDVILLKDYDKVLSVGALNNKTVIYSYDKTGGL